MLKSVNTRFRAYQLGCAGASYSYFADCHFTLIESMITKLNEDRLREELEICGKTTIDTLHITSWDSDHCSQSGLTWILENLHPKRIEYPGYDHDTACAIACKEMILAYQAKPRSSTVRVRAQRIDPPYVRSLNSTDGVGYTDIFYHPREVYDGSNDNSSIKFFRKGSFNVLSLGDVESSQISSMIRRASSVKRETDILILAHHGADNGFTTKKFLEEVNPSVAICTSNYDNHHDHPRQEIRELLYELKIPLYTTKTGDIIIESTGSHRVDYHVTNMKANSTEVSSERSFKARKARLLSMNDDTIRARAHPGTRGPKRH